MGILFGIGQFWTLSVKITELVSHLQSICCQSFKGQLQFIWVLQNSFLIQPIFNFPQIINAMNKDAGTFCVEKKNKRMLRWCTHKLLNNSFLSSNVEHGVIKPNFSTDLTNSVVTVSEHS